MGNIAAQSKTAPGERWSATLAELREELAVFH
jgi:hypothetical protein